MEVSFAVLYNITILHTIDSIVNQVVKYYTQKYIRKCDSFRRLLTILTRHISVISKPTSSSPAIQSNVILSLCSVQTYTCVVDINKSTSEHDDNLEYPYLL